MKRLAGKRTNVKTIYYSLYSNATIDSLSFIGTVYLPLTICRKSAPAAHNPRLEESAKHTLRKVVGKVIGLRRRAEHDIGHTEHKQERLLPCLVLEILRRIADEILDSGERSMAQQALLGDVGRI